VRRAAAIAVSNSDIVDFEDNPAEKGAQTVAPSPVGLASMPVAEIHLAILDN
jgi:hypothetical protein